MNQLATVRRNTPSGDVAVWLAEALCSRNSSRSLAGTTNIDTAGVIKRSPNGAVTHYGGRCLHLVAQSGLRCITARRPARAMTLALTRAQ
jgi:hypothetical protein